MSADKVLDDLQTAIEASIGGQLDVATLIESAMLLTQLEMQPPPPGTRDDQEQQVRLENPPPGVERAEIWVSPPTGEKGIRALSLRVQLQRRIRPYVVAGAPRDGPELDLTVIADKNGAFLEHRILTRLQASSGGQATQVIEGVACMLDPSGGRKDSFRFLGRRDGKSAQWDGPVTLTGADPTSEWNKLEQRMWSRLQEIRQH